MADAIPEVHHGFVTANGQRFELAQRGEGDRLALCLHGFPECWAAWRFQVELLERLGFRVWMPNLRGYGQSSKPPRIEDYAIETLLEDVGGLIDASGARSTVLIGHDWGAILAWHFAIRRVRPLERLIVMNVPHPGAGRAHFGLRQALRSWYAVMFQLPWLPEKLLSAGNFRAVTRAMTRGAVHPERFPPQVMEIFRRTTAHPGTATAAIHYYRAYLRGGGASRQRTLGFPVIETPTLFIWGERDVALTVETTLGTGDYVKDLTMRYIAGASHWVQQDTPETVNEIVEAWLTGKPVPGSPTPTYRGGRS